MKLLLWEIVKRRSDEYQLRDMATLQAAFKEVVKDVAANRRDIDRIQRKVYRDEAKGNGHQAELPLETEAPPPLPSNPLAFWANLRPGDTVPPGL